MLDKEFIFLKLSILALRNQAEKMHGVGMKFSFNFIILVNFPSSILWDLPSDVFFRVGELIFPNFQ